MGNGVGKVIGAIAGAAACFIPGVGPVAGALIFAATTTAGSGADALVDIGTQNGAADRAAAEQRKNAAIEIERQRVAARQRLEESERTARENLAEQELVAERNRQSQNAERDRQAAEARAAVDQLNFVEQSLAACRNGDFTTMAGLLAQMNAENFNAFADGALAACTTADALEECRVILEQEQMRREVVEGWRQDVGAVINAATNNPRV